MVLLPRGGYILIDAKGVDTTTLAPKGETTHYDLCVALLLQIMFAVHANGAVKLQNPCTHRAHQS